MTKNIWIIIIIVVVVAIAVIPLVIFYKQGESGASQAGQIAGLKIEVLKGGIGEAAKNGDTVAVHYTGTLKDGTKFDSSLDRGQPFVFPLGAGYVIKGWDLGVLGMKVGEKRRLTIAPELGYGARAVGSIPANSTLVFEVELVGISAQAL